VAAAMAEDDSRRGVAGRPAAPVPVVAREVAEEVGRRVADVAWERVGLIRSEATLEAALREFDALAGACLSGDATRAGIEARNAWTVARVVAEGALLRRESRGAHYRDDHPRADDASFLGHIVQRTAREPRLVPVGDGPLDVSGSP